MFIDRTNILIRSGDGGNGVVSFRREKYIAAGGPDGGNGGKGGDVIFEVDKGTSTLAAFRYKRKFFAQNGSNGEACKRTGKSGAPITIKVPLGTLVTDSKTGRVLADMAEEDDRKAILHGGKGGAGNMNFATSTRQVPNFAKSGEEGKELELTLELKLLADVGIVGFPNVGKSTLLSVTTGANPEIADYHFTTLFPNLGVVNLGDESNFVLADIPGLIEGASQGVGLGHRFLRHIERTRLIIHVIDMSGSEGRNPYSDFLSINNELGLYNEKLSDRPQIIVANKMDIAGSDENLVDFKERFEIWLEENNKSAQKEIGAWRIFEISAEKKTGTRELMLFTGSVLSKLPKMPFVFPEEDIIVHKAEEEDPLTVYIDDEGSYIVAGAFIKRLVDSVNLSDSESSQYFQRTIRKSGLIDELKRMDIKEGDTVKIYDIEFDYLE